MQIIDTEIDGWGRRGRPESGVARLGMCIELRGC